MSLHLIKLCVGCDSVADLEDWIKLKLKEKKKRGQKPEHIHTTRMLPKRAEELVDGGSLYWVIKGQITCREKILDIRTTRGKDGVSVYGRVHARRSRAGAISRTRRRRAISRAPRPARRRCRSKCGGSYGSWGCCEFGSDAVMPALVPGIHVFGHVRE